MSARRRARRRNDVRYEQVQVSVQVKGLGFPRGDTVNQSLVEAEQSGGGVLLPHPKHLSEMLGVAPPQFHRKQLLSRECSQHELAAVEGVGARLDFLPQGAVSPNDELRLRLPQRVRETRREAREGRGAPGRGGERKRTRSTGCERSEAVAEASSRSWSASRRLSSACSRW